MTCRKSCESYRPYVLRSMWLYFLYALKTFSCVCIDRVWEKLEGRAPGLQILRLSFKVCGGGQHRDADVEACLCWSRLEDKWMCEGFSVFLSISLLVCLK